MHDQDAELVARWRRGEPAAFEALVQRWQAPIARFLGRYADSASSAADLSQEVFVRVYQARKRYRENGAFAPWLYRIAINVARDAGRKRRHHAAPLTDDLADPAPSAAVMCGKDELARVVAEALAALPDEQRLVLVFRHYEEISFEDISRLTGVPASTLKSRFAAALERLRHVLEAQGHGPEEI